MCSSWQQARYGGGGAPPQRSGRARKMNRAIYYYPILPLN